MKKIISLLLLLVAVSLQAQNVSSGESTLDAAIETTVVVAVYPNPSADFINVEANSDLVSIQIYNTLGQTQLRKKRIYKRKKRKNNKKSLIDITNLAEGVYFLEVETDAGRVVKQIVKI